jgi:DNA-binding CsgD family transcriptional regulator/pimeloyl-ACP methyl ester carboxylesterase
MSSRGLSESHVAEHYALDLEALVDQLRLERLLLVGGFFSGQIAVTYSVRHPERLEALVLINATSGNRAVDNTRTPAFYDELPRQNWQLFVETVGRTAFPLEDALAGRAMVLESTNQADYLVGGRSRRDYNVENILGDVKTPTLVVGVTTDAYAYATEEATRRLASLIPSARLCVFDDAGMGMFSITGDVPPVATLMFDFLEEIQSERREASYLARQDGLSERELQVLRLVAAGRTNQEIALELVLSPHTVVRHVSNIFDKIHASNRAEATTYAHRHNLA